MESVGRAALCGPPFPAALGAESNQKLSNESHGLGDTPLLHLRCAVRRAREPVVGS
jgi:hypothetical protein